MSVLEMRQVSKSYGDGPAQVDALNGVDLSVCAGMMVAVMGPSGSGKSTLLTIAGGLERQTGGEVLVAGRELSDMTRNDRARLRRRSIGYVFQDYNLLPGLTAVENVTLPLELDGVGAVRRAPPGWRRWRSSASATARRTSPTSSRAGNGSGWRSPARWWENAGCCWPTSHRGRSTRPMGRR